MNLYNMHIKLGPKALSGFTWKNPCKQPRSSVTKISKLILFRGFELAGRFNPLPPNVPKVEHFFNGYFDMFKLKFKVLFYYICEVEGWYNIMSILVFLEIIDVS